MVGNIDACIQKKRKKKMVSLQNSIITAREASVID